MRVFSISSHTWKKLQIVCKPDLSQSRDFFFLAIFHLLLLLESCHDLLNPPFLVFFNDYFTLYLRKGGLHLLWPLVGLTPCNFFTHALSWFWKAAFPFFLAKCRLFSTKKLGKFWKSLFFNCKTRLNFLFLNLFPNFPISNKMKKNTGEKEDISRVITNHSGAGCSQNNCIMHGQGNAYFKNLPHSDSITQLHSPEKNKLHK